MISATDCSCTASTPSGTDRNPLLHENWQQQNQNRRMAALVLAEDALPHESFATARAAARPSQCPQRRAERLRFLVAVLDEALSISDEPLSIADEPLSDER
jgi:FMN-dependent NADH-azoreductase